MKKDENTDQLATTKAFVTGVTPEILGVETLNSMVRYELSGGQTASSDFGDSFRLVWHLMLSRPESSRANHSGLRRTQPASGKK